MKNPYGEWFGCLNLDQLYTDVVEVQNKIPEIGSTNAMLEFQNILLRILKGEYAASIKGHG